MNELMSQLPPSRDTTPMSSPQTTIILEVDEEKKTEEKKKEEPSEITKLTEQMK